MRRSTNTCRGLLPLATIGITLLSVVAETHWHSGLSQSGAAITPCALTSMTPRAGTELLSTDSIAATMTTPDFKPFVFVPLTLPGDPGDWTVVADTGVFMNSQGNLVATLEDSSGNERLFVWWDEGHDNGSTTTGGWQGPIKDSSGNAMIMHAAGAHGINTNDEICGTLDDDSDPVAFFFEFTDLQNLMGAVHSIGNGYAADLSDDGVVVGMSSSGLPVAWLDDNYGSHVLPPLPDGDATAASGVEPGGGLTPIVAGQSEDAEAVVQAVAWRHSGGSVLVTDLSELLDEDDAIGIATSVANDGHIVGAILDDTTFDVLETVFWYYHAGSWTAHSFTSGISDFLPAAIAPTSNEVVGADHLWVPTSISAGEGEVLDLQEMTIALPDGLLSLSAWDINDAGEICGIAHLDDEDVPRLPFKIVPFDTDNNGTPDYREIVNDRANLDTDGNWLLDRSEQMRVGLFAAGLDPDDYLAGQVDDIQAIRLHFTADAMIDVATDPTTCANTAAALNEWGHTGSTTGDKKEIVVMVRSKYPGQHHYDYILTGQDKEDYLDALFCVAYRYALDIDFMQFGNEIFSGPGEYLVETACHEGLQSIRDVDEECYAEAGQQIMDWIAEQIAVARMASALAGRPLRFITPSYALQQVLLGKDGDLRDPAPLDPVEDTENRAALGIEYIIDLGNTQQAWADIHLHYAVDGDLEDALYYFVNPNPYTWTSPDFRTCMEWSPVPTDTWAETNNPTYRKYFWTAEGPPTDLWDDYVYGWGDTVLERENFPDFNRDLTGLASNGLLHACYGEYYQGTIPMHSNPPYPLPEPLDLPVLRATAVVPDADWIADYTNLFTDLKGDLEEDNGSVFILSFAPHPNEANDSCDCAPRP